MSQEIVEIGFFAKPNIGGSFLGLPEYQTKIANGKATTNLNISQL